MIKISYQLGFVNRFLQVSTKIGTSCKGAIAPLHEVPIFVETCKNLLTNPNWYDILIMQTRLKACFQSNRCGSGSVVEHLLAKEKVAGSIPVSRSLSFLRGRDKSGPYNKW